MNTIAQNISTNLVKGNMEIPQCNDDYRITSKTNVSSTDGFEISRTPLKHLDPTNLLIKTSGVEPGHDLGDCVGTNIDMKVFDHAVAGAVNGGLAFAILDESTGIGNLTLRKYGETITSSFKRNEDKALGGIITSGEGDDIRKTTVFFKGLNPDKLTITLSINDKEHMISMKPESFHDGHFYNTTFSTKIDDQPVSFKMHGACCFGLAVNMNMMILGAYVH